MVIVFQYLQSNQFCKRNEINVGNVYNKTRMNHCGNLDILNFWDLLGTYAFFATISNTVSTQQVSKCKSVGLSVMLSPPKPFDKIQPNLVIEFLT